MREAVGTSEAASVKRDQEVLAEAKGDSAKKAVDVLTVTFKSDYLFAVNSSTLCRLNQPPLRQVCQNCRAVISRSSANTGEPYSVCHTSW